MCELVAGRGSIHQAATKQNLANPKYNIELLTRLEEDGMVMGCIVLIPLAEARKLCLGFENPVKSYVWHWPVLKELGYDFVAVHRCAWEPRQKPKTRLWKKNRVAARENGFKRWLSHVHVETKAISEQQRSTEMLLEKSAARASSPG